jgi:hypothetical protein
LERIRRTDGEDKTAGCDRDAEIADLRAKLAVMVDAAYRKDLRMRWIEDHKRALDDLLRSEGRQ